MDFLPGQGEFETAIYRLDVTVGDKVQKLEFGILPPIFETTLSMINRNWAILGADFLRANLKESVRIERDALVLG